MNITTEEVRTALGLGPREIVEDFDALMEAHIVVARVQDRRVRENPTTYWQPLLISDQEPFGLLWPYPRRYPSQAHAVIGGLAMRAHGASTQADTFIAKMLGYTEAV